MQFSNFRLKLTTIPFECQTVPFQRNIAIGCMAFSVMKLRAQGIGHVGMELQRNSCASVGCFTMKMLIAVTGRRMLRDARNIVNNFFLFHSFFVEHIIGKCATCNVTFLCHHPQPSTYYLLIYTLIYRLHLLRR